MKTLIKTILFLSISLINGQFDSYADSSGNTTGLNSKKQTGTCEPMNRDALHFTIENVSLYVIKKSDSTIVHPIQ